MADHDLDAAVKLASNENPFSPLPSVLAAIDRSAADSLNRYADHRAAGAARRPGRPARPPARAGRGGLRVGGPAAADPAGLRRPR